MADGSSGLQAIDVSDPASPAIVSSVVTADYARDVAVSGGVAYVVGPSGFFSGFLDTIDVSDPANPAILGSVGPGYARGIAVSGGLAYLADNTSGVQVIDVSDPASPVIVGAVDTPGFAAGVALGGGLAYVADTCSFQVIDVSSCPPCPGDTDASGAVDVGDLVNVILDWATDGSAHGGDVNGSGTVNVDDLVAVILAWGPCP